MIKGFNRLTKYKRFDAAVLGYFRALEITKNHEEHTYHPHFHVLLPVKKSYFTGKLYISQKDWTSLWKKAMDICHFPLRSLSQTLFIKSMFTIFQRIYTQKFS